MKKSSDPVDVVPDKVVPAADELVRAVVEKIGPLADAAADALAQAAEKASPLAHAAVEQVGPLAHTAVERLAPVVQSAAERVGPLTSQAVGKVTPYAQQAAGAVGPLASQAAERVGPLAQQAAAVVTPYAVLAKERGLKAGQDAAGRLAPAVGTAVGSARGLSEDVLPKVSAALAAAAASPLVTDAVDRGRTVVRAAREADVVAPPPPPAKKKSRWVSTLALLAAAGGAAYVIARKLRGDKGSQWQTARPSAPYVPPASSTTSTTSTTAAATGSGATAAAGSPDVGGAQTADTTELYGTPGGALATDESAADAGAERDVNRVTENQANADEEVPPVPSSDPQDSEPTGPSAGLPPAENAGATRGQSAPADADTSGASGDVDHGELPVSEALGSTEEHDTAVGGEAPVSTEDDNEAGVGPDAHPERYSGPGAYVGIEPPEGFTIKGNERSMKYHLPGGTGYARTIAEVWFSSEEAAQEAGFTRAQR